VFVAMCVIPVYEFCMLGDAVVFNTIEFWSGKESNPIALQDGDIEETEITHDGQQYQIIRTKGEMTIAHKASKEEADFKYFPEENKWYKTSEKLYSFHLYKYCIWNAVKGAVPLEAALNYVGLKLFSPTWEGFQSVCQHNTTA